MRTLLSAFHSYVTKSNLLILEARGRNPVIQSKPNTDEIIRAIEQKRYVGFYYEEEDEEGVVKPGFRVVEPYVYGKGYVWNGRVIHPDREYLRGYVVMSTKSDRNDQLKKINRKSVSKSNRRPRWRLFRVDRIQSWQIFRFKVPKARNQYNPDDQMIGDIIASAQF